MMFVPKHTLLIFAVLFATGLPSLSFAAGTDSLAITLTPPLFQITQSPGTDWKSLLRVVNSNSYDITVNVKVQDFHPNGETGNPEFEELTKGTPEDAHRMSGWIEIPEGNITITHSTTAEIPFTVHVPLGADPGGHYAAIIVGTVASKTEGSGSGVSSAIGSLMFMRVPGEVVEKGEIRDFYAAHEVVQSTDAKFVLRFENQGNVHLIPQGNIEITNMWGKVRGKMDINQSNTFGNVLPKSTRKFEFTWQGDASPFEVGRYKAVATLVYGLDGRQTVYRTVYFWIIPWKPVAMILGGLIFFLWFISWSVRRYIRNALQLEREWMEAHDLKQPVASEKPTSALGSASVMTFETLRRPLTLTAVDMRASQRGKQEVIETVATSVAGMKSVKGQLPSQKKAVKKSSPTMKWLSYNRSVVFFLLILAVGFSLVGWYFVEVFQNERAYHVEQVRPK